MEPCSHLLSETFGFFGDERFPPDSSDMSPPSVNLCVTCTSAGLPDCVLPSVHQVMKLRLQAEQLRGEGVMAVLPRLLFKLICWLKKHCILLIRKNRHLSTSSFPSETIRDMTTPIVSMTTADLRNVKSV